MPWHWLSAFVGLLGPSAVVAVVVTALLLWVLHRRALRGRFVLRPTPWVSDPTLLRVAAIVLVVMLALLVSGLAPWMPTTLGALVLIAVFAWRSPRRLSASVVPWQLVLFAAGLFLAHMAERVPVNPRCPAVARG